MKEFMGRTFLLKSKTAETLFFKCAEEMPVFDFHNHLSPKEIYENLNYRSITELWLLGDHYKWRAMRAAGVEERYITGDASDEEKFLHWAKTVERLPGSPLYHWAHLELQRYFDISVPLTGRSAPDIYRKCGELLAQPEFTPVELLKRAGVKALCTTDDPFDGLQWHGRIAEKGLPFEVRPTFRPDKILHIQNQNWVEWVAKLGDSSEVTVGSFADLKKALSNAAERFQQAGCLASDMGFTEFLYARDDAEGDTDADAIMVKAMSGSTISRCEAEVFESKLLRFLGELYFDLGFCMQLHIGAERNVNTTMFRWLGPDSGYDNIASHTDTHKLALYLDDLETKDKLPRTILYGLNPADLPVFTSLAVSFCSGEHPGKVQVGSAWWFNDTEAGMRAQLTEAAISGLLSSFVGMVTDSRSFSSFVRHEYFRRILCDFLGDMVEKGEYPEDGEALKGLIQDVCYFNAKRFFTE